MRFQLLICKFYLYMLPWSSGQDAALSRLNQGFDSPWKYQHEKRRSLECLFSCTYFFRGESNPQGRERLVRCFGEASDSERFKPPVTGGVERQACVQCKTANSPWKYQHILRTASTMRFFCYPLIFQHLYHFNKFCFFIHFSYTYSPFATHSKLLY